MGHFPSVHRNVNIHRFEINHPQSAGGSIPPSCGSFILTLTGLLVSYELSHHLRWLSKLSKAAFRRCLIYCLKTGASDEWPNTVWLGKSGSPKIVDSLRQLHLDASEHRSQASNRRQDKVVSVIGSASFNWRIETLDLEPNFTETYQCC